MEEVIAGRDDAGGLVVDRGLRDNGLMFRWGPEGPPPEAYSRVTNPERFRPLHDVALTLLEQLHASFNVERVDGYGLDSELEVGDLARPAVTLIPNDSNAAPLTVALTTFPGLKVRVGRWCTDGFPACGCDACDETAATEAGRLQEIIDAVVAGRFREAILLPPSGDGWQEWEMWSPPRRWSGRSQVARERAQAMLAESERFSIDWAPWTRRK
jgi:Family of unknown function (DUF6226)